MARIKWVQQRLENWAAWSRTKDSGGLGYPSQSPFVRLGPSSGQRTSVVPVDGLDAALTERAVQSMRHTHEPLWLTLKLHYIEGYEIYRVAKQLCVAESTIKARLGAADARVAAWFEARAEVADKRTVDQK